VLCCLSRAAAVEQGSKQRDRARLPIKPQQHAQSGGLATAYRLRSSASTQHVRRMLHLRRTAQVRGCLYMCHCCAAVAR